MFTPEQLRPLLAVLAETEAVIVGGQAINLWSEVYQRDEEPWRTARPFTSRDLAALGSATDLLKCAQALGGEALYPEPGENTINTGKLTATLAGLEVTADFLGEVKGLGNQEIRETAVALAWQGLHLRVLHPVLCVESKTANLMRLAQDVEGRQDKKHLLLALANAREFLALETTAAANHPRLVRWAQRLRRLANDQLGLEAADLHGIDYQSAIPCESWVRAGGALGAFLAAETDAWRSEVREELADFRELREWLARLKSQVAPPIQSGAP